jgi:hypothetical protein
VFTFAFSIIGLFLGQHIGQLANVSSSELVQLANKSRVAEQTSVLAPHPLLKRAAEMKLDHMEKNQYFAHVSPDGIDPWHWFRTVGYDFQLAGENLAMNFKESEDVNQAWLDSPTHRANLMNAGFVDVGIAARKITMNGKKTVLVVQVFGKQKPLPTKEIIQKIEEEAQVVSFVENNNNDDEQIVNSESQDVVLLQDDILAQTDTHLVNEVEKNDKDNLVTKEADTDIEKVLVLDSEQTGSVKESTLIATENDNDSEEEQVNRGASETTDVNVLYQQGDMIIAQASDGNLTDQPSFSEINPVDVGAPLVAGATSAPSMRTWFRVFSYIFLGFAAVITMTYLMAIIIKPTLQHFSVVARGGALVSMCLALSFVQFALSELFH